ncbi:unnamed protein product [Cyprideis torosa]|uniref:Programmed cell death protein 2 C-terminal domain-containing protein n=1 Tax=Cyprideis torosa TaxID=163714 RepID=A0A7R8ZPE4_9CRUS|nr:unnamed protein product [Cyprideis torosa]CAG0889673.1 unnamed protein product [Cyprideis torosa]
MEDSSDVGLALLVYDYLNSYHCYKSCQAFLDESPYAFALDRKELFSRGSRNQLAMIIREHATAAKMLATKLQDLSQSDCSLAECYHLPFLEQLQTVLKKLNSLLIRGQNRATPPSTPVLPSQPSSTGLTPYPVGGSGSQFSASLKKEPNRMAVAETQNVDLERAISVTTNLHLESEPWESPPTSELEYRPEEVRPAVEEVVRDFINAEASHLAEGINRARECAATSAENPQGGEDDLGDELQNLIDTITNENAPTIAKEIVSQKKMRQASETPRQLRASSSASQASFVNSTQTMSSNSPAALPFRHSSAGLSYRQLPPLSPSFLRPASRTSSSSSVPSPRSVVCREINYSSSEPAAQRRRSTRPRGRPRISPFANIVVPEPIKVTLNNSALETGERRSGRRSSRNTAGVSARGTLVDEADRVPLLMQSLPPAEEKVAAPVERVPHTVSVKEMTPTPEETVSTAAPVERIPLGVPRVPPAGQETPVPSEGVPSPVERIPPQVLELPPPVEMVPPPIERLPPTVEVIPLTPTEKNESLPVKPGPSSVEWVSPRPDWEGSKGRKRPSDSVSGGKGRKRRKASPPAKQGVPKPRTRRKGATVTSGQMTRIEASIEAVVTGTGHAMTLATNDPAVAENKTDVKPADETLEETEPSGKPESGTLRKVESSGSKSLSLLNVEQPAESQVQNVAKKTQRKSRKAENPTKSSYVLPLSKGWLMKQDKVTKAIKARFCENFVREQQQRKTSQTRADSNDSSKESSKTTSDTGPSVVAKSEEEKKALDASTPTKVASSGARQMSLFSPEIEKEEERRVEEAKTSVTSQSKAKSSEARQMSLFSPEIEKEEERRVEEAKTSVTSQSKAKSSEARQMSVLSLEVEKQDERREEAKTSVKETSQSKAKSSKASPMPVFSSEVEKEEERREEAKTSVKETSQSKAKSSEAREMSVFSSERGKEKEIGALEAKTSTEASKPSAEIREMWVSSPEVSEDELDMDLTISGQLEHFTQEPRVDEDEESEYEDVAADLSISGLQEHLTLEPRQQTNDDHPQQSFRSAAFSSIVTPEWELQTSSDSVMFRITPEDAPVLSFKGLAQTVPANLLQGYSVLQGGPKGATNALLNVRQTLSTPRRKSHRRKLDFKSPSLQPSEAASHSKHRLSFPLQNDARRESPKAPLDIRPLPSSPPFDKKYKRLVVVMATYIDSSASVLLGLQDETLSSSGPVSFTDTFVGFKPNLPPSLPFHWPPCPSCGCPLSHLLQLYAPLDPTKHRVLSLFACAASAKCQGTSNCWKCLRFQWPAVGEPDVASLEEKSAVKEDWLDGQDDWGDGDEECGSHVFVEEEMKDTSGSECSSDDSTPRRLCGVEDMESDVPGRGRGGSEEYEKAVPKHGDQHFFKFHDRLRRSPHQLLRYYQNPCSSRGMLLLRPLSDPLPLTCPHCFSALRLEAQLMPPFLSLVQPLHAEEGESTKSYLEFGTVLMLTCVESCSTTECVEETVVLQEE